MKPAADGAAKLTVKQRRFIDLYEGNAAEAALLAGYSVRTACSTGEKLLKNAEILRQIQRRKTAEAREHIATQNDRRHFWTRVMNDENISMSERLRASELLGKAEVDFIVRTSQQIQTNECAAVSRVIFEYPDNGRAIVEKEGLSNGS